MTTGILRKPKKNETPLETLQRFAEYDERFVLLLDIYSLMEISYLYLGVDRLNGTCGMSAAAEPNAPSCGFTLNFKKGVFHHFRFTDASGYFTVKANDEKLADIVK